MTDTLAEKTFAVAPVMTPPVSPLPSGRNVTLWQSDGGHSPTAMGRERRIYRHASVPSAAFDDGRSVKIYI